MAVEYKSGYWTEWTNAFPSLTQEQKNENAITLAQTFYYNGWTPEAIAGMLGNVFGEGLGNPGQWEIGYPIEWEGGTSGRGLVGWTPWQRLTNWLSENGYADDDPAGQVAKMLEEWREPNSEPGYVFWVVQFNGETNAFSSYEAYSKGTLTPEEMAHWFMNGYERPGDTSNLPERQAYARQYYDLIIGYLKPFEERLDTETPTPMSGNKYYYDSSYNPFWPDFAPPAVGADGNCTWYAYGRFSEIASYVAGECQLPTGDGGVWFPRAVASGVYETGQEPRLGAVICFEGGSDGGHVAIVERILDNGDVLTSNSAYGSPGTYFYTQTYEKANGYDFGSFSFQGFIYNPYIFSPGPTPTPKQHKMPLWFYLKKRKEWYM